MIHLYIYKFEYLKNWDGFKDQNVYQRHEINIKIHMRNLFLCAKRESDAPERRHILYNVLSNIRTHGTDLN